MSVLSHYPCQVLFEKHFERGHFHGLVLKETMGFMNMDDAVDWAKAVSKSNGCEYFVPWVEDLNTGERKRTTWLGL